MEGGEKKNNWDVDRVIWAIRGMKLPQDNRQGVCICDLNSYKHLQFGQEVQIV